jgi:hypothetical protein
VHLQSNDLFEIREHEISEIALLHVAITRVIQSLTMPIYGNPYEFLLLREWGVNLQELLPQICTQCDPFN